MNFRYIFEKKGEKAPENILENDIWIDVGNDEKEGVFDHHQGNNEYSSAFECVMKRTDCYERVKSYLKETHENPEIVIHVHEYPDIDCLFSIFAVKRMIQRNKANPAEAFDAKTAEIILDYVNKIDSGRGKDISKITLYAYFCQIGMGIKDTQKRSQEYVDVGLELLELVVGELEKQKDSINLFKMQLEDYINVDTLKTLKYYSDVRKNLEKNYAAYQNDKKNNCVVITKVPLWNHVEESMKPVKAAIWKKLPSGEDEYIFARDEDEDEDGCLLTVYPYDIKEENSSEGMTRVIIALNPNMSEAEKFTLRPLAEILEQYEQMEEELFYEQTGRYRRDHSQSRNDQNQSRKEEGRFDEIPFCETSDPWYFSEKGDIIDAPGALSIIPYSRILSIIENGSSVPESACIISFKEKNEQIELKKEEGFEKIISFGDLYEKTRKEIIEALKADSSVRHLFAFVKIKPSMLSYSNNWLSECCLNMVGKSDSNSLKDNILQIDFRTCLYTDQSITILVAVDRRNQSLDSLVCKEELEESQICKDLKNILEHQSELRNIGKRLSEMFDKISQESQEIDRFNKRLVQLNTRIEEDDLIADPLEQEVYAFIKNTLGLESLKNSVTTSAQLLIKNAEQIRDRKATEDRRQQEMREKEENKQEAIRDNKIQAGIGFVSVLAVFSAFVDAYDFFAKLATGSDGGWAELLAYHPRLFILEIIFAILIFVVGIIAIRFAYKAWKVAHDKEKDE